LVSWSVTLVEEGNFSLRAYREHQYRMERSCSQLDGSSIKFGGDCH